MDNSSLYYSAAEIEYRRRRAARIAKSRTRRGARSLWHRFGKDGTT